jgi:hypothetical protein
MPTRTASMSKRIAANGQALHRAMARRMASGGADSKPSETESALMEERRLLKAERDKLKEQGPRRRPSALERLVRTHHPEAKHDKAKKKSHDEHETKKPKHGKSRPEKHAQKAAALEAARKAPKKPAK